MTVLAGIIVVTAIASWSIMNTYLIEYTDTFGGDANYSWVRRYKVKAVSQLGAIQKFSRQTGSSMRFDGMRYNSRSGCTCAFVELWAEYCDHTTIEL